MAVRAEMRSLKLFWVLLLYFLVSKGLYLYAFNSLLMRETTWSEVLRIALLSFRFDLSMAAAMSFFSLVLSYLLPRSRLSDRLLSLFSMSCIVLTAVLCQMDFNYYAYYHSRFHVFLWEVFDGGENAALVLRSLPHTTSWSLTFFQLGLQFLILWFTYRRRYSIKAFERALAFIQDRPKSPWIIRPLLVLTLLTLVRGIDAVPLGQLSGKTLPSADLFLVDLHSNPFYALYSAWKDYRLYPHAREIAQKISRAAHVKNWNAKSAKWQLQPLALDDERMVPRSSIKPVPSEYLRKKPKHIVLITMETLTLWPLESQGSEFVKTIGGVFPNLFAHSLVFDQATYPGIGTLGNNLKIIFGIPSAASFPPETAFSEILSPMPTSLPRVMQDFGYRPAYFYGGSLAWHRLGPLLKQAGFDKVCGESCIEGVEKTRFGLHDDDLFTLLLQHLDAADGSTFTQAMTRSNHPPFDLPAAEWLRPAIEASPELAPTITDQTIFQKRFRAYRYATEALGRFLKQAEARPWFNDALFVITADHSIDNSPLEGMVPTSTEDVLRFRRIPLVFYGPGVLQGTPKVIHTPANHIDLMPTLVAFASDEQKPVKIASFGRSLFEKSLESHFLAFDTTCNSSHCLYKDQVFARDGLKLRECPRSSPGCESMAEEIRSYRALIEQGGLAYLFGQQPEAGLINVKNSSHEDVGHTH